jgi:fido (protein-threonine AMPylation protein)
MMYGLSESRFLALHASIFSGPRELAGIYRSIVMKAGNNQFVDFWEIKNEMNNLFSQKYKTA